MGNAAGRSLRTLGDGEAHAGWPLAAALEFIHTNNCSNPISMRVSGLLRPAVYSSKHRSRVA
jgi:hypothetical protein